MDCNLMDLQYFYDELGKHGGRRTTADMVKYQTVGKVVIFPAITKERKSLPSVVNIYWAIISWASCEVAAFDRT